MLAKYMFSFTKLFVKNYETGKSENGFYKN